MRPSVETCSPGFKFKNGAPSLALVGFALLINGLALSLVFSPGTSDVEIWNNWMREISNSGVIGGYTHSDTDYPPLAFILLGAVSKFAAAFGVPQFLVLKFSLLLFLIATAASFYWFTRNLVLTAALEFALTLNSMGLAYLDIYFAPFLIAGLFLLQRGNLNLGFALFAISCAIKWQPLIVAPFVCLYVFSRAGERSNEKRDRFKARIVPFALVAAIALPIVFVFGWKIFDSLRRAMTYHIFLSAYGLNFSWIHTWILHLVQPEKYGALQNGGIGIFQTRDLWVIWPEKSLFYISYAVIFLAFARQTKTFERLIVYSMLGYLAYFVFNTSVHENHLFLVCVLAWMLAFLQPDQLVRSINFSLAANANLFLFYGVFGDRSLPRVLAGFDITILFAVANLCLFGGFLIQTVRADGLDLWFVKLPPRQKAAV